MEDEKMDFGRFKVYIIQMKQFLAISMYRKTIILKCYVF